MAYTYPTLSMLPTYPLEESFEDLTIRTEYEAGYDHTRPKFTNSFRKSFNVKYIYMTTSDKTLLDNFLDSVEEGLSTFTWTNPQDSGIRIVRFYTLPIFSYVAKGYWNCEFILMDC